jgi:hypothetical protein
MVNKWYKLANGWHVTPIPKNACTSIRKHGVLLKTDETPTDQKCAVIRHPCDRLVSIYFNQTVDRNCVYLKENLLFDAFIAKMVNKVDNEDCHTRPQFLHLNYTDITLVNFNKVGEFFSGIGIELEKLNSSTHDAWETYFNPGLRNMVERRYSEDLTLYNLVEDRVSILY